MSDLSKTLISHPVNRFRDESTIASRKPKLSSEKVVQPHEEKCNKKSRIWGYNMINNFNVMSCLYLLYFNFVGTKFIEKQIMIFFIKTN